MSGPVVPPSDDLLRREAELARCAQAVALLAENRDSMMRSWRLTTHEFSVRRSRSSCSSHSHIAITVE